MDRSNRILITGGNGFLGNHVIDALRDVGYANLVYPHSVQYDLRSSIQCDTLFKQTRPDAVLHLAAKAGGIGANQSYPADFFYDNITMGVNVIDSCKNYRVNKVIYAGTVCSYPEHAPVPIEESCMWHGYPEPTNAGYGLSKRAILGMIHAYVKQHKMDITPLILINMYGPGDKFEEEYSHIIPALIKRIDNCIKTGEDLVVWGTGKATREFLHVRDAAKAFTHFLDCKTSSGEEINMGTGKEYPVHELVKIMCDIMGFEGQIQYDHSKPNGQMRKCLEVNKTAELYGFKAKENLKFGLEEIINDYRNSI